MTEVITESASTRTARNKSVSNFKNGYMGTLGYQTTTCMTSLIAYAIGVSEKELLANGLGNFEEFKEFYTKNAPKGSKNPQEDIDMLDSATIVGNIYTNFENREKNARAYTNMYSYIFDLAQRHMRADSRIPTMETIGEMFFRVQKMNTVFLSSLEYLGREGHITQEGIQQILGNEDLKKLQESNKKRVLSNFLIYQEGLEPGSAEYDYAKAGNILDLFKYFDDDDEISSNGMKKYRNSSYDDIEQILLLQAQQHPEFLNYINHIVMDDFQQQIPWDNSIFQYGARIINQHRERQNRAQPFSVDNHTLSSITEKATLLPPKITYRNDSLEDDDAR